MPFCLVPGIIRIGLGDESAIEKGVSYVRKWLAPNRGDTKQTLYLSFSVCVQLPLQ